MDYKEFSTPYFDTSKPVMSGQIDIDFAVFNIYQYDNANLTGHYTGPMTME